MAVEKILLLSGAIGAGKTSIAKVLMTSFAFQKIGTSDYLISQIPRSELREGDERRLQLQELGDRLDRETDYRWVIDPVAVQAIAQAPLVESWLIDAVRKKRQVEHFRNQFGPKIRHIHLTAPEEVLRARHAQRGEDYDQAIAHPNEVNSRSLIEIADHIVDTSSLEPGAIASHVLSNWEV
jgi:chloramphenicol 3-O-phosphotransferase